MTCPACPNPANCSPTFCHFADADLKVTMYEPPESPQMPPSLARAANERIRQLEAAKTPLHIRVLDYIGNKAEKFGKWWDGLNDVSRIGAIVFAVSVCAVGGLSIPGVMR